LDKACFFHRKICFISELKTRKEKIIKNTNLFEKSAKTQMFEFGKKMSGSFVFLPIYF